MNNKRNLLIILVIVLVLLIVALSGIVVFAGNSRNIIKSSVNNTMDLIADALNDAKKEMKDVEEKTVSATADVKLDLDLSDNILSNQELKDLQAKLNKTSLKIDTKINQKQKVATMILNLLIEDKELINLDFILDDKIAYIKSKDIIEDYIKVDIQEIYDEKNSLTDQELNISLELDDMFERYSDVYEELDYIFDLVDPVIRKEIMKGQIEKSKDEIEINGETIKVNKHTIFIDELLISNVSLKVLETIKEDDKALENLISILEKTQTEITKDELLDTINDEIDSLKEDIEDLKDEEETEGTYFSVYTKGIIPKVVQYAIYNPEDEEEAMIKLVVNSKDNYSFEFIVDGEKLITAEGLINEKEADLKYNISSNGYNLKGKIVYKEEKSNKSHLEFTLDTGDDLLGSIGIIIDSTNDKSKKDIEYDVSNATTIDDISEDELMEIYQKFEEKLTEVLEAYDLNEEVFESLPI